MRAGLELSGPLGSGVAESCFSKRLLHGPGHAGGRASREDMQKCVSLAMKDPLTLPAPTLLAVYLYTAP